MKRLLILLALSSPASAALTQRDLAQAVARPPVNAKLPASLSFTDQRSTLTTLGQAANNRPLVLIFADYTCRHICGPGVTLTTSALAATGFTPGQDYALAIIGLDPRDDLNTARAFVRRIGNPQVARSVHLLTGTPATITAATRALGYGTAYDADTDQFAHDASLYVFAPDGHLVTLLPELGATPAALKAALTGAATPPTLTERIATLCYGLAATHGRFATPAIVALQSLAALTLAAIALFLYRRRRA